MASARFAMVRPIFRCHGLQFVKIDSKVETPAEEPAGEVQAAAAAPVIETAVYMSRVERARLANAAKNKAS